jgi:hypothetical protein
MRRSSRTSKKKGKIPENLSDLAAWLYTDLLLGLAVAFVGAGAFAIANPDYLSPTTGKVIKTFQLSCDALEIPATQSTSIGELESVLLGEIKKRGNRKGWTQVKPGVINLFGGGSTNSIGTANAKKFMRNVTDGSALLKNSEILPYADNNLSTSQLKMRIYLVYKGDEKDNGC